MTAKPRIPRQIKPHFEPPISVPSQDLFTPSICRHRAKLKPGAAYTLVCTRQHLLIGHFCENFLNALVACPLYNLLYFFRHDFGGEQGCVPFCHFSPYCGADPACTLILAANSVGQEEASISWGTGDETSYSFDDRFFGTTDTHSDATGTPAWQ